MSIAREDRHHRWGKGRVCSKFEQRCPRDGAGGRLTLKGWNACQKKAAYKMVKEAPTAQVA